ncbi:MAG: hypothetical protein BAJALOKI3v1_50024 [Promethearchaeota archaeon]|nr:MAG: hypothetical protein BAJALOKI3v1_50024 [Candidatus Lokiarchaeota archaeon]
MKDVLIDWFYYTPKDVLEKFASLDNSISHGEYKERFVFIPGSRQDRVLLVAHADTVFNRMKPKIKFENGVFSSELKNCGIGADDRAGCAIVWALKDLGHSIFIADGEESGCVASNYASSIPEINDMLQDHQFMIEFDRRGSNDLVFYDVGTKEFKSWCQHQFDGYKTNTGSFTDISVLAKKICGVNISIGYYSQHTSRETLVYSQWLNTLEKSRKVLSQKNIPKFELKRYKDFQTINQYDLSVSIYELNTTYQCDCCNSLIDKYEIENNNNRCPLCYNEMECKHGN